MSSLAYERVHENLRSLKLDTIEGILDNYLEMATRDGMPILDILDHLFGEEQKSRLCTHTEMLIHRSSIPYSKKIGDFDFSFQPSIDSSVINEMKTLRFVYNSENVVFLGPPGVGKTHLAIGLGIEAMNAGMPVYFVNAAILAERLLKAHRNGRLQRYIHQLNRYRVLIVDEIGYHPFDADTAYCFFQLVCARYEAGSMIFTSNKSYSQWGEIFQDTVVASAVLDRILHHCTTVNIKGDSYRMKDRMKGVFVPTVNCGKGVNLK